MITCINVCGGKSIVVGQAIFYFRNHVRGNIRREKKLTRGKINIGGGDTQNGFCIHEFAVYCIHSCAPNY